MIIQELDCKAFGCFYEKKVSLYPGINLITGGNEAGKSTVFSFLRCMLYGMRRGRGRAVARDDYHRLLPWGETQAEGSLCFSCQGKTFRLHRIFRDRQELAELFCTEDGEVLDVPGGDLHMLLGGLGEGLYEHVVSCAQQTDLPTELWKSLENYLLNMETVQEEQTDVEQAIKLLEARGKRLRTAGKQLEQKRQQKEEELRRQIRYVDQRQALLQEKIRQLEQKRPEETLPEKEREPEKQANRAGKQRTMAALWSLPVAGLLLLVISFFLIIQQKPVLAAAGILAGIAFLALFAWKRKRPGKKPLAEEKPSDATSVGYEQELAARIAQLQEELLDARLERENAQEELGELEHTLPEEQKNRLEIQAIEDAMARIRKVAAELSGDWAGRLTGKASEILAAITGGRYAGLQIHIPQTGTGANLTVTDRMRICTPDQLSTGTGDQIKMAVRLSAAMLLEEEPMPLIFDDAFLTWDDDRLSAFLAYLADCGRQILIFTGQNREEMLLIREKLSYHKIVLDESRKAVYSHTDMRYDNSILQ